MKNLIVTLVCVILSGAAFSQVTVGAKAGINISNLSISGGNTTISYSSKVGLNAGGFAEFMIGENFAVQPELTYSEMGAKGSDGQLNINYLQLPVLAKYYFTGFAVYAGPQVGFLLSAKAKAGSVTTDFKDQVNSTDFDGVVGAEYNFDPGIVVSARYIFGLSNIDKTASSGESTKINGFQITLGYKFLSGSKKK
jgi:hypothetical protein